MALDNRPATPVKLRAQSLTSQSRFTNRPDGRRVTGLRARPGSVTAPTKLRAR